MFYTDYKLKYFGYIELNNNFICFFSRKRLLKNFKLHDVTRIFLLDSAEVDTFISIFKELRLSVREVK